MAQVNARTIALVVAVSVLAAGSAYGGYRAHTLQKKLQATEQQLAERIAFFKTITTQLEEKLGEAQKENEDMKGVLTQEQKRNLDLEREKRRNERQISTLTKLTTLDPELLKKYSKVYFLNENYVPESLELIDAEHALNPAKPLQILADVRPNLERLLEEAEEEGVPLKVLSAYRSFEEQKSIKSAYTVQFGATAANRFSAEQGYSEHQLGTTVDFTTPTIKTAALAFENAPAFKWLTEKAHYYGFVLSYPKGNQYYTYEPWHWRFVGRDLAEHLHDEGEHFYDLDQREIDTYLLSIFDR